MVYCARGRERGREEEREGGGAAVIASADCSTGSVHTLLQFSHAMLGTKKKERERDRSSLGGISQPAVHNHVR